MIPAEHPCLSAQAHFRYGRIHLPVAPRCNIRCGYCDRRYDCANESRPGVTSEVISPEAALDRVERALRLDSRLRVAGVAGPGEPLANPATLETLRLIHARFPRLLLCLSTNGLVLSDALPELLDCGVSTLTVTVNTRSVVCAGEIEGIACWAARAGAAVMNLMPLIPQAGFRDNEPPSRALLEALRARARVHIPQFTHCRQCRADAVGVPGE